MISIRKRCACGCGEVTNPGKRWVHGHNSRCFSKDAKKKMGSKQKGVKHSKETKLKMSLSSLKPHPQDEYCEVWRNREYKKDLRKDYCENVDCKRKSKNLIPHHINLNKKDCRPFNIMTLCNSCHTTLHRKLVFGKKEAINPKEYLTVIRTDRIIYIHKRTRQVIATITRIQEDG